MNKVTFLNNKPCKETTWNRNKEGYGISTINNRTVRHHRYVYKNHYGKESLTSKEFILHACDNPSCIEISHLFLGDAASNSKDMVEKKRHHTDKLIKHKVIGYTL